MTAPSKLGELLQIADTQQRQKEMLAYAQSLRVDVVRAKREDGGIKEEELTILIYDAEQGKKNRKFQNIAFILGGIIFVILVSAFLVFLARSVKNFGGFTTEEMY